MGKSSLFNLLTEQNAAAENYPFCTIEPNEARCPVPDERYVSLFSLSDSGLNWVVVLCEMILRRGEEAWREEDDFSFDLS